MNWPRADERLFKAAEDWENNACLNYFQITPGTVADGFKEGAEKLAEASLDGNAVLDLVIYPICYLYRQYLELKIKEIIDNSRRLEQRGNGYPTHHRLDSLWSEASQLLMQHYGDDLPQELSNVRCCIEEFQQHDATSMAFRYPTDKNGRRHLQDLRHINLRNLNETMGRISNLLDCIASDLAERLQCLYQM